MLFIKLASSYAVNTTVKLLRFYQRFISPFKVASCRFYPSCSEYSIQALQRYGLFRGSYMTILRLVKCHPFHHGGYDPVI